MLPAHVRSRIAADAKVMPDVIAKLEERLAAGDPLPYVARRFPEELGGLTLASLRKIRGRLEAAGETELRRANLLRTVDGLGEAGGEVRASVMAAHDTAQLDDLAAHLRKPKGTRGAEAAAKGLEALSDLLFRGASEGKALREAAEPFVSAEKGVATADDALHGAAAILAERYAAEPEVRARVRRELRESGEIVSKLFDDTKPGAERYKEFFDHRERGKSMALKRYVKLRRGERERVLRVVVEVNVDAFLPELEKR